MTSHWPATILFFLYACALATIGCQPKGDSTISARPGLTAAPAATEGEIPAALVGGAGDDEPAAEEMPPVDPLTIDEQAALVTRLREDGANVELDKDGQIISLVLGFTDFGDAGVPQLAKLPKLEFLGVDNTKITDAALTDIGRIRSLKILHLRKNNLTGPALKPLAGLAKLEQLDISQLPISDADLTPLKTLKNLDLLNLDHTRVTLEGVVAFAAALPDLEVSAPFGRLVGGAGLTMDPTVTDGQLARLKVLTTLRRLNLSECDKITDAGIAHVAALKQLTWLELGYTQVSDAGLAKLAALKDLELLDLRDTQVTMPAALKLAAALPKLHVLAGFGYVNGASEIRLDAGVTDAEIAHLKLLPNLARITLFQCGQVSDAGLAAVAKLSQVTHLNLGATNFGDPAMTHVAQLTNLKYLNLANTSVSDKGLEQLKGLTSLADLDLSSTAITSAGLKSLAALPLKSLSLATTAVTDAALADVAALKQLEQLNFDETRLDGSGLAVLAKLPNLKTLHVALTHLSDDSLRSIAAMKPLRELDLSGTPISDAGLKHLESAKQLMHISLYGAPVSDQAVAQLQSALPKAKIAHGIGP
jgi:Leucine-rich repeat (LRR) protein